MEMTQLFERLDRLRPMGTYRYTEVGLTPTAPTYTMYPTCGISYIKRYPLRLPFTNAIIVRCTPRQRTMGHESLGLGLGLSDKRIEPAATIWAEIGKTHKPEWYCGVDRGSVFNQNGTAQCSLHKENTHQPGTYRQYPLTHKWSPFNHRGRFCGKQKEVWTALKCTCYTVMNTNSSALSVLSRCCNEFVRRRWGLILA